MRIVQDTLCGIRTFTLCDTFLDWDQVQNILIWAPEWGGTIPFPAVVKPKPLWTGKQILSMTIPQSLPRSRAPVVRYRRAVRCVSCSEERGGLFTGLQIVVNPGYSTTSLAPASARPSLAHITNNTEDRDATVSKIIEDGSLDRSKAAPGMGLSRVESSESSIWLAVNTPRRIGRRTTTSSRWSSPATRAPSSTFPKNVGLRRTSVRGGEAYSIRVPSPDASPRYEGRFRPEARGFV